jgi:SAM-dependent methyltransferase
VLRLSDLAREGMDHSGSFRFADHLYTNIASGRGFVGRWLDRLLLDLPATRAMRERYHQARTAMGCAFESHLVNHPGDRFRILTVPCGLPRDVKDFAAEAHRHDPSFSRAIEYIGLDLDPDVVAAARVFLQDSPLDNPEWIVGDALRMESFPNARSHFISSTGLGEFLDDETLACLYQNVFSALAPGGMFFTSATARENRSDVLLRAFELDTHYRTDSEALCLLNRLPWHSIQVTHDSTGLQTFIRAVKA